MLALGPPVVKVRGVSCPGGGWSPGLWALCAGVLGVWGLWAVLDLWTGVLNCFVSRVLGCPGTPVLRCCFGFGAYRIFAAGTPVVLGVGTLGCWVAGGWKPRWCGVSGVWGYVGFGHMGGLVYRSPLSGVPGFWDAWTSECWGAGDAGNAGVLVRGNAGARKRGNAGALEMLRRWGAETLGRVAPWNSGFWEPWGSRGLEVWGPEVGVCVGPGLW